MISILLATLVAAAFAVGPGVGGGVDGGLGGVIGGNVGGNVGGGVAGGIDLSNLPTGFGIPMGALDAVTQAQLKIAAAQLQTNADVIAKFAAFSEVEGSLKLASAAAVDASLITEAALNLGAKLTVDAAADVRTANLLVLQANGELDVQGKVSALGLILEESNKVWIGKAGEFETAVVTVQADAVAEIRGSFKVINKQLVEILEGAKLTLGAAADATASASVEAKIALKDAKSQLTIAKDLVLSAESSISGAGEVIVQASLDAKATGAGAFKAGKLTLEKASKLYFKAAAESETVVDISGEATLDGELIVEAGEMTDKIVIKHASRVGEFAKVTINGAAAAKVSASAEAMASAGRKRAALDHEAGHTDSWDVAYGDKETTATRKAEAASPETSATAAALSTAAVVVGLAVAL